MFRNIKNAISSEEIQTFLKEGSGNKIGWCSCQNYSLSYYSFFIMFGEFIIYLDPLKLYMIYLIY